MKLFLKINIAILFNVALCFQSYSQHHIQIGLCKDYATGSVDTFYSRVISEYDTSGNMINSVDYFQQNPNDTDWTSGGVKTYTYDSLNRMTSWTWYSIRYFYTYNSNGDLTVIEKQQWNQPTWVNENRYDYNYDAAHHMLSLVYLQWNTGAYDTSYTKTYQYQFNGQFVSSLLIITDFGGTIDSVKQVYFQDVSGRDSIIYIFGCSIPSCTDTARKTLNAYSPPFDTTVYEYGWQGGNWPTDAINTRTYNPLGSITENSRWEHQGNSNSNYYYYDANNYLIRLFQTNSYYLHPSNNKECLYTHIFSDSLTVYLFPVDSLCPSNDLAFLALSITGGTPPYSVSWQDPAHNGPLRWVNPDSTTTYYYTVMDSAGTTISDSITVFRRMLPSDTVMISGITSLCPGDTINLTYSYPALAYASWRQGNLFGYDPQFAIHDTGTVYMTIFYHLQGCPTSNLYSFAAIPLQQPQPALGKDTMLCVGQSILLDPGMFTTYLWQNGSSTSTYMASSPIAANYTYYVTVTDSNNCMNNTDSISVTFDPCASIPEYLSGETIFVQNPFSNFIRITLPGEFTLQYVIYNVQGKIIKSGEVQKEDEIDMKHFSQGMYLISVSGANVHFAGKLIKVD